MTEHTDTPPVAGETTAEFTITSEMVKDAEDAQEQAWREGESAPMQMRAAIAAALSHLTAERDAETTRLRAELAEVREDHERNRRRLFELGPIIDALTHGGVAEELVALRARDAAWKAHVADLVATLGEIECVAWRGVDKGADVAEEIYQTMTPRLPAVLADPAPSTPAAQETP